MGPIVKTEPLLKKTNKIPHCKRCERHTTFGHTTHYCNQDVACVKCTENHLTKDCTLNRDEKAEFINCRGNHPTSFRGWVVAKERKSRKEKATRSWRRKSGPSAHDRTIKDSIYFKDRPKNKKQDAEQKSYELLSKTFGEKKKSRWKNYWSRFCKGLNDKDN